jgi:flagellar assembly factor FliW
MRAVATMEGGRKSKGYSEDSILTFQEGLIGFSDCKSFVLLENRGIAPFRRLQCTERPEIGFLVLDPIHVVKDFVSSIPMREWQAIGLEDPAARLAFVICIVGPTAAQSTGNFQAPILINYANMTARQVILADSPFSSWQPLI